MSKQLGFEPGESASGTATRVHPGVRRRPLARIVAWIEVCAGYYAATAIYEQLSRLSDAELQRRGLTRASLARDVCAVADRSH